MNRSVDVPHRNPSQDEGLVISRLFAGYGSATAGSDVNLEIRRSEFVTLLGPSGCGKTTTLRCVAGLHTPRSGEITLDGQRLCSPDVNVPPHKRDINMVFQSYAVWPHMTTLENVMYGLKSKKLPRARARSKAKEMLDLVGLAEFAARHATDLSGGQQQRVALARALATEPSLVLMDEPLSNLDAQLRARMRDEIRQIQRRTGITVLYVTHDQSEALSMSDRVVVMNRGTIQQVGDPWALYHRPENAFVATFVGEANVVPGVVTEIGSSTFTVRVPTLGHGTVLDVARATAADCPSKGDAVSVVFRPEWVRVSRETGPLPAALERNEFRARLVSSEFLGDHFERMYEAGEHRLRVQAVTGPTSRPPEIGADQTLLVPPENLTWFRRDDVEPHDSGEEPVPAVHDAVPASTTVLGG
ncbi:ABC-type spermidine/putrescine transport system, ATPase component [Saccharomonospora marina XMU15]|uniref:ABC-type spermidine/putrescine transport system, ATPase component n=1 Tax=Saccharomonospora marina XMU15 TaxID=882083 RepID=H5X7E7_9PSEU|nr:ABC-type spermidine/putrescine transport system, ATPase component [Saccharomonospora marina XMU15]